MEDYQPPFTINNEMLLLVSSISENVGRISEKNILDSRPHLRRDNRIRSIHSSLAIEANSLSLDEIRSVISGQQVAGPEKEIREVQNAYRAYEQITVMDPYAEKDLLRIHGIMTEKIVPESGIYRHGNEGVFSGDVCIFMAPPPEMVPELMRSLFSWMCSHHQQIHPLILSSVFHYEFVFIHPFTDGNGRMARLWQTALLYEWNPIFQYIPLESQIQSFQQGYYDAISACHQKGNSDEFILFMLKRIDEILKMILRAEKAESNDETDRIARLLSQMEPGQSYSAAELMLRLGLRSRKSFRENYLKPAMALHKIKMTDPDHPRNRNQKYIRRKK